MVSRVQVEHSIFERVHDSDAVVRLKARIRCVARNSAASVAIQRPCVAISCTNRVVQKRHYEKRKQSQRLALHTGRILDLEAQIEEQWFDLTLCYLDRSV